MTIYNVTEFDLIDRALEKAKQNARTLQNSQTADIVGDLIDAIEILSDIVEDLQQRHPRRS
jgi:hypothetical protein